MKKPQLPVKVRFLSHIRKGSSCWLWDNPHPRNGYGSFSVSRGKPMRAHRFSYEMFVGPVPKGMHVLHTCDNPSCVRPEHLFLGNAQDNMFDKVSKGRQARGENHGLHRLTSSQVREIRKLYAGGYGRRKELAALYGVSGNTIYKIARRRMWAHVS